MSAEKSQSIRHFLVGLECFLQKLEDVTNFFKYSKRKKKDLEPRSFFTGVLNTLDEKKALLPSA